MNNDDNAFSLIMISVHGNGITFNFNEGGNVDAAAREPVSEGMIVFDLGSALDKSKTVFP